jgi:hypothetical protein
VLLGAVQLALARPACFARVPADGAYFIEATITKRQRISCSAATKAGRRVWQAYKSLPVRNYPPPPNGVPGGKGEPFHVSTPAGGFTCRMLSRGSDFVIARCRHGSATFTISDHRDCCAHPAPPAPPRLDGTFRTQFVVVDANNVTPGAGATGTRTWIFEHEGSPLFLLEGLANGGFARVQLHRSARTWVGTSQLSTPCPNDPSQSASFLSKYTITITGSAVRSGQLLATSISADLRDSFTGCGSSGSEVRSYTGSRIG